MQPLNGAVRACGRELATPFRKVIGGFSEIPGAATVERNSWALLGFPGPFSYHGMGNQLMERADKLS
jgi:hypothetical protein